MDASNNIVKENCLPRKPTALNFAQNTLKENSEVTAELSEQVSYMLSSCSEETRLTEAEGEIFTADVNK